jgi:hypothetical protein
MTERLSLTGGFSNVFLTHNIGKKGKLTSLQ